MSKTKREIKNITVSARITDKLGAKLNRKCIKNNLTVSDYLNTLIENDLASKGSKNNADSK